MTHQLSIALVGCGRVAARHFEALTHYQTQAKLVAVCDNQATALARAVHQTGAEGFSDLKQLLQHCSADLIVLCTPSGLHAEQAILCAQAGRHVMTEKPMATRFSDGKRMVHACEQANVHLFEIKQNRLNPTLQLLRSAIVKKRFGRIYLVNVNVFWTRSQSYYDQAEWRGSWALDGGALMNQACHYIDLLDWLIGSIESVHAYTATLARTIETEDTAVANIKWRSGALGSVNVTMLTHPQNLEGSITILGETGSVRIGGVAVNEIQHWEFAKPDPDDKKVALASYETSSVYGHGHSAFYDNVFKVLRGQSKAFSSGRDGLHSLETLTALYLSAREGRRVSLPLEY